jgi:hypothetical protein
MYSGINIWNSGNPLAYKGKANGLRPGTRIRVKNPDMDAWTGRDYHPRKEDAGKTGTIVGLSSVHRELGEHFRFYNVKMAGNRGRRELVNYEFETVEPRRRR